MAETALVTGASSGIGTEFAKALAGRGYEVILVARRAERLQELSGELEGKAHAVPCDLATEAAALPGKVAELGLEVDLLVNNAGFGTAGPFLDQDPEREAEEIRLNCEAVVRLTHAFLPGMIERDRGGVITVASTAGMQPLPYEAVYSATKAFALTFSDALSEELRKTNVRVLAVNPGPVPTEWQEVAGYHDPRNFPVPGAIPPERVVELSLRAYDRGKRSVIPGRIIRLFMASSKPSPRAIQLRVTERMYRDSHK